MSSKVVSKIQYTSRKAKNMTSNNNNNNSNHHLAEDEDQIQEQIAENAVTSHLYLKPAHSSQAMDKEVVLQRIRQRKRANKLGAAIKDLIRLPIEPNNNNIDNKVSLPQKIRWLDDAFAAL